MTKGYLQVMVRAAYEAGREIMRIYTDPLSDFEIERKADNSPLTVADRKAHQVILSYLDKTPFPVLSEEGRNIPYEERRAWPVLWIVDPLDGTKEFIKRNGEFTVNIALLEEGIPVAGVVYVPVRNIMYVATQGEALRLDRFAVAEDSGELSYRSETLPLASVAHDDFVVVASRSHLSEDTKIYIEKLKEKHGAVRFVSSGSSIKICLVAEGTADVYPRFAPTMEWDTAAGHALARQAGCEIYHAGSDLPLMYNKEDLLNPSFIVEKRRIAGKWQTDKDTER